MRTPLVLVGLALLAAGLSAPTAQAVADAAKCQGKPATIVQTEGIVEGTDGDDVIVGGKVTRVRAGGGDDTICVTGGGVQGGQGADSVKMRGSEAGDGLFLVDVERVDIETGPGRDTVNLEWGDRRGDHELLGQIDGGGDQDFVLVDGARDISVVLSKGKLRLGPGTSVDLLGFEGAFARAWWLARVVGDAGDNLLGASGCYSYVAGGPGDDDIDWSAGGVPDGCNGLTAKGQGGDDVLHGSSLDDYLDGGPGRDRAYGQRGLNRCPRVEVKRSCG